MKFKLLNIIICLSSFCLTGFTEATQALFSCRTTECVEIALVSGAKVNGANQYGETPLMFAAHRCNLDTIHALLVQGAEVNAANVYGRTILMQSTLCEDIDILNTFLEAGVNNLDSVTTSDYTALRFAITYGRIENVEALLEAGAKVNALIKGSRDLIIAVKHDRLDIVKTLIARGVDVNERDDRRRTALWWAEDKGHTEIAEVLRADGATL